MRYHRLHSFRIGIVVLILTVFIFTYSYGESEQNRKVTIRFAAMNVEMTWMKFASHAMREEGGVLEVSLQNVDLELGNEALDLEPGRYVKLSVSDTGTGSDLTTIDRIFDPYFTTKGLGEGTGIGLSVVHGIVKNHDGAVMVKSEPGKGAVLEVFFPLTEAKAEPEDKEADALPTDNEKIFFVDDEESLVKMAERMLEMQGYQVESKSDPVEALELFRCKPDRFDLVKRT